MLPPNKGVISYKWVFNRTYNDVNNTIRFKARLIRECVDMGRIELEYIKSKDNTADVVTKTLRLLQHKQHTG